MSSHPPEEPNVPSSPSEQAQKVEAKNEDDPEMNITSSRPSTTIEPSTESAATDAKKEQKTETANEGTGSRKKARLQWDEENLSLNAAEMERTGPRMKIDEPKTPFCAGSASENGSSASDSAHQSPPESPAFIPRERLVGFNVLEQDMNESRGNEDDSNFNRYNNRNNSSNRNHRKRRESERSTGSSGGGGNVSDGASSAGSGGRSVHISDDNLGASTGSSPRSREAFASRRRAHYRNEARVAEWIELNDLLHEEDDDDEDDNNNNSNNQNNSDNNDENQNTLAQSVVRDIHNRLLENGQIEPHPDSNNTNNANENGLDEVKTTTENEYHDTNGNHKDEQRES